LVGEGTGAAAAVEQRPAVFRPVGTGTGVQVAVGAPAAVRVGTVTGVADPPRGTGLADALGAAAAAVGVGEPPNAVGATEGAALVGVAVGWADGAVVADVLAVRDAPDAA
jgi:hypothetical protein